MYYGTPSALIGFGAVQHNTNFAWANQSVIANNKAWFHATTTTNAGQFQDAQGINYFTPALRGPADRCRLRPKVNVDPQRWRWFGPRRRSGFWHPGVCGYTNATTSANCLTNDYSYQDVFDVGANYLNKFGDVTVAAYGAFMYGSFIPGNQPFAGAANHVDRCQPRPRGSSGSSVLQFGFKGFTLGGAIGWDNQGLGSNYYTGVDNDTRFYTAGIMYETGPWQMSFSWVGSYNTTVTARSAATIASRSTPRPAPIRLPPAFRA